MQREVHLSAESLLASLRLKKGDFAPIALVSGQKQRAELSLKNLAKPVRNFDFLGYTFWTGIYKGRRLTIGNGGLYSPDSAFVTELLCAGGVDILIRLGSCGALREDIKIGDYILATDILRGDGATRYYVDKAFRATTSEDINSAIENSFTKGAKLHKGGVWTTDALFRETKDIVNSYIEKGAIAVDMVTSSFITVANLYGKKAAAVLVASDNLITGQLGFNTPELINSQETMISNIFDVVEELYG